MENFISGEPRGGTEGRLNGKHEGLLSHCLTFGQLPLLKGSKKERGLGKGKGNETLFKPLNVIRERKICRLHSYC